MILVSDLSNSVHTYMSLIFIFHYILLLSFLFQSMKAWLLIQTDFNLFFRCHATYSPPTFMPTTWYLHGYLHSCQLHGTNIHVTYMVPTLMPTLPFPSKFQFPLNDSSTFFFQQIVLFRLSTIPFSLSLFYLSVMPWRRHRKPSCIFVFVSRLRVVTSSSLPHFYHYV